MIIVEHFEADRIDNPGNVDLGQFYKVRNAIVRACRKHGTVGPLGLFPFGKGPFKSDREFILAWEAGDPNPAFFVNDDQYNSERYQYLECCRPEAVTVEWMESIMDALRGWKGWGVGVNAIHDGYLLILSQKLMVKGPAFPNVHDLPQVVAALRRSLGESH